MQNIQVVRPVFREKGGHQRICDGFKRAIRISKDEHAPEQEIVSILRCASAEGDEGREDVADKGKGDELAVTDLVHNEATKDDAKAEAREASAADGSELGTGETVFLAPVVKDTSADGEADAGGQDGHEACPEEAHSIVVTHSREGWVG